MILKIICVKIKGGIYILHLTLKNKKIKTLKNKNSEIKLKKDKAETKTNLVKRKQLNVNTLILY